MVHTMGSQLRPFSDPLMGFSQSIILLSLIVQPSRFRFILFIPVLLCNLYLITRTTTQNPGKDNIIGSVLATHLLTASDFILLTNPQKALKLWTEKEPIALNPVRAGSLFGRVKWGFQLFLNPRGIGWEHEPINSLRSKPTSSRWNFVASQVLWTCAYVLLYDLAGLYRHWAGTNIDLSRMTMQGERMSLPGAIFWRSMHLGMFGTISVTHMCISYTALSAVLVGVGVTEPRDWPHLFGYWSRAYTIRNFWGKVWHQLLRRPLATHCRFISSNLLGIPRGTVLSSYIQLLTAWLISGLVHGAGEYMATRAWPSHTFKFFFLQALGITVESLVIELYRKSGLPRGKRTMRRVVGYVWVWCWFLWVLDPVMSEKMLDHGMHFSVLRRLGTILTE